MKNHLIYIMEVIFLIYINLSETIEGAMPEEITKLPSFFKRIFYKIRKKLGVLYIKSYDDKILITLSSTNKNALKRLEKYIKVKCIKRICLSNMLLKNEEFLQFIKGQDVNVLNGEWLFNYIITFIIDYIIENKNEKIEMQEISILTKDINEVLVDNIKTLASRVKLLNIITTKEAKFKKVEKDLYEQKGIMLNINNNYKKSLLKSDIILNLDFTEEEFNNYNLPKKACVIQKKGDVKIQSKGFEGICITGYEISLPRKYLKYLIHFKDFDNILLYESFIYKKTNTKNIHKEIEDDGLYISFLNGKNGKIRKTEIKNLSKNKNIY